MDKRSKFGLDVLPLEALLDYNEDDVKECHFEVSMFAEMFKEMLQTRFARGLIRGMAIIEHQVRAHSCNPPPPPPPPTPHDVTDLLCQGAHSGHGHH